MRSLVFKTALLLIGVLGIWFFIIDQQKTRFLIDNNTNLENINISVSASGTNVFEGRVAQSLSRLEYGEKVKTKIGKPDILYVKVELPDLNVMKEEYLHAKGADYVFIRIYHSNKSLAEFDVRISSASIEDAREYRIPGL